jgi:tRNA nucleotidyltransferase/poly(A) polymerase
MKCYLVGGAIRDRLLNLSFSEKDFVVIGETETSMLEKGFISVGKKFPVFLHPKTKEEYALARKEKKIAIGHQGFSFETDNTVTLEEDLSRRDLTINAIAEDEKGNLIDPFNGQKDLKDKILRHVSLAFSEDPLRIFRVARFATKFCALNFEVDKSTIALMKSIPKKEIENLSFERIWQETEKVLKMKNSHIFFEILNNVNALFVFPEIDKNFSKSVNSLKKINEESKEEEKWAALNLDSKTLDDFPIPRRFIRFEKYSRDFKETLALDISKKVLLEALMKINAFRDKKLALQIIIFLQNNNKLNSALISLNLDWDALLSELNSVTINKGFSENGELIKKEIYNTRLNILGNYLNE